MSKVARYFGLEKIGNLMEIVKDKGGILKSLYVLYRESELKTGKLVGQDAYGNKYYENNTHIFGRNRWVVYAPKTGMDFEGTMITPEWFGWVHYKTDAIPTKENQVQYSWIDRTPTPNNSATSAAYTPYSTVKPKIQVWQPPKAE